MALLIKDEEKRSEKQTGKTFKKKI